MRATAISGIAAAVIALAALGTSGAQAALAAMAGGVAMVAGNLVAAATALRGGFRPAAAAFTQLVLGTVGKWVVVVVVVGLALARFHLPPLPMLAGLVAVALTYLLALGKTGGKLQDQGTRRLC